MARKSPTSSAAGTICARGAELWSVAACCRFPPRELARGNFDPEQNSPPASWLAPKRQQASVLQSSASYASLLALLWYDHAAGRAEKEIVPRRKADHRFAHQLWQGGVG